MLPTDPKKHSSALNSHFASQKSTKKSATKMGGQLSSSSSSSSSSSTSSPSPGLSSLGSNGQRSARCRSPPPTQSASQSSLALSSCSSSAAGRCHSGTLIRPLGAMAQHSPLSSSASASSSFGHHSRLLVSPPMFRRQGGRQNERKANKAGGNAALSRWGSFTRALPALVRGNSNTGQRAHVAAKELKRQAAHPMVARKYGTIDPNNNRNGYVLTHPPSSYYEQPASGSISPWSDREEQCHESADAEHRHDLSLKQSLKKSGSRFFNGFVKGGNYLRTLLGDGEEENESEDEEKSRSSSREEAFQRQDLLNNNNGPVDASLPFGPNLAMANGNYGQLRPSQTAMFSHQAVNKPTTISTSALRSSLRQAKQRHFGTHSNGNGGPGALAGGNGLMSSMLLAMAAGKPPSASGRPLSYPAESSVPKQVDWNGNNGANAGSRSVELFPASQRKKVIQASSSELIRALGNFICQHCRPGMLGQFEPAQLSTWLRSVDRALILQGWQDVAFINPANLVFLFMLIRDALGQGESQRLSSLRDLHSFVLLCLYVSYSYMGNEISYPLKPFITENTNRTLFWSQCVRLIKLHSGQMLRLNSSSTFFLEVFTELKAYCPEHSTEHQPNAY